MSVLNSGDPAGWYPSSPPCTASSGAGVVRGAVDRMDALHGLLHSAHHLYVFERAARRRSFTAAARELNVSQPSVSRSVRQIEEALGLKLFIRHHRSVTLTEEGEALFQAVASGFGHMYEAAQRLHRRARTHVSLLATADFIHYWLVPRLPEFHRRHPEVDLRVQVCPGYTELADESSLAVRFGHAPWEGYESVMLAREEVFPVASPEYARGVARPDELETLSRERLLHEEVGITPSLVWSEWFGAYGFDYRDDGKGLRMTQYALLVQAALAGEGIALGWSYLVEPLIERGLLDQVGRRRLRTDRGIHLIWPAGRALAPKAEQVKSWIIEAAHASAGSAVPESDPTVIALARAGRP